MANTYNTRIHYIDVRTPFALSGRNEICSIQPQPVCVRYASLEIPILDVGLWFTRYTKATAHAETTMRKLGLLLYYLW